ncbi:MAG: NAD-dependent epimerase/dehydratase family protein, partial [Gaiellaceae bacterium]
MGTAFVTGGSGFVGGALVRRLVRDGWTVRGLARSDASATAVRDAGAEPVRGDVSDLDALRTGARGAEVVFHAAAKVEDWGPAEEYERVTVQGTRNALAAARDAGVRRFVHVGTEAALMAGKPLVNVDETAPLRPDSPAPYPWSKAKAEQAVRDANGDGFETVVVRPRFVWG